MRVLTAVLLVLSTPAFAAPTSPPKMAQAAGEAEPPQSVWRMSGADAEHLQSGLRCPLSMGEYRRVALTVYDPFGLDVSCGYNANGGVLTMYLTRGPNLDVAYQDAKQQLLRSPILKNPKQVSDAGVQQGGLDWRRAQYTEDGGKRSDIWMTELGGWVLEYRATYLPQAQASVDRELAALTGLARASAGERLGLCARHVAPARPGREITDRKRLSNLGMMGAILRGTADVMVQEGKTSSTAPVTFCVEGPVQGAAYPSLSWRAVLADGSDAKVDRITRMTQDPSPQLDIGLDPAASMVEAEASSRKAELWAAAVRSEKATSIYAYYEGRPSEKLTADLFSRVLSGKAKPIGGFSVDGKTINIIVAPGKPPA